MKRVLLAGAALATLLLGTGAASAETATTGCSAPLSVHNNTLCTGGSFSVEGTPTLAIQVGIGPVENVYSGDVQVTLKNASETGLLQLTCVYRVTTGFTPVCLTYSEGDFTTDPVAICSGRGSGVGQWAVSCTNGTAAG